MAAFRVGQRVRVVRPTNPRNYGVEGRITEMFSERALWNGWANCKLDVCREYESAHTDQLEPILDQHDPCEADFKASLDELLERQGVAA